MSSFVLMTRDGPPELIVESGKKISKDPVMLSGLFKAIYALSSELTDAPIQLIQVKGFTIRFKNILDDRILIVGSDRHLENLNILLEKIHHVINEGMDQSKSVDELESDISILVEDSLDHSFITNSIDESTEILKDAVEDLRPNILELIFQGILNGTHFKVPNSKSVDFNDYLINILNIFNIEVCDGKDNCPNLIQEFDKRGNYKFNDIQCSLDKKQYKQTKILKKIMKYMKKKSLSEMILYTESVLSTISFLSDIAASDITTESKLKEINLLRYTVGIDLEYYILKVLAFKNPQNYEILINNTDELEWIHTW